MHRQPRSSSGSGHRRRLTLRRSYSSDDLAPDGEWILISNGHLVDGRMHYVLHRRAAANY
jgi:hypothetical protein